MDLVRSTTDAETHLTRDAFGWVAEADRRTLCGARPGTTLAFNVVELGPSCLDCRKADGRPAQHFNAGHRPADCDDRCTPTEES